MVIKAQGDKKMKIYFIRHGESVANHAKLHSGWSQVPLSAKGEKDAERSGRILAGLKFDKVFSSDIKRAMQTCEIALPGVQYQPIDLLREINVGFLAGRSFEECREEYGEEYAENRKNYEFKKYGGECYDEFLSRTKAFLEMAVASEHECIAAFCHGGFINNLVDVIVGTRTDRSLFSCHNCSVTVLEYKNESWNLLLWNYTGEI